MSDRQMQARDILMAGAAAGCRRWRRSLFARASWVGTVVILVLADGAAGLAGPLDVAGGQAPAKFQASAAPPAILQGRLPAPGGSVQVAALPQGALYASSDGVGKARLWLARNNAIVAELVAPASAAQLEADWPGSFAFSLGGLPVVAISWRYRQDRYGIEELAFWAAEGKGRFLGGLPGSTRNPCGVSGQTAGKDCGRCAVASGIPIDVTLTALGQDRVRFVQQRAATWYYYFGAAAETFEQDFVLTANGLVPDGPARAARRTMPVPQAKERVKGLLRDYFKLAKSQTRQSLAPEFLTCFEQLATLAPDFGQAHYNVGCMHALLGNHQQAVASVTKALTLNPEYRKLARRDPDLESVRDDPELARMLGE
jgi:tetratricopeptide (TPR) repeat protein